MSSLSLVSADIIIPASASNSVNLVANGYHQIPIVVEFSVNYDDNPIPASILRQITQISFLDYYTGVPVATTNTLPAVGDSEDPPAGNWWWTKTPGLFTASYNIGSAVAEAASAKWLPLPSNADANKAGVLLYLSSTCLTNTVLGFSLSIDGTKVPSLGPSCKGTLTCWMAGDLPANGSGASIEIVQRKDYSIENGLGLKTRTDQDAYFKNFYFSIDGGVYYTKYVFESVTKSGNSAGPEGYSSWVNTGIYGTAYTTAGPPIYPWAAMETVSYGFGNYVYRWPFGVTSGGSDFR